jgi:hypothetical protein
MSPLQIRVRHLRVFLTGWAIVEIERYDLPWRPYKRARDYLAHLTSALT